MELKPIAFLVVCLLCLSTTLSAQLKKTVHQTFPAKEHHTRVFLNVNHPVQYVHWPGNSILIETTIILSKNGSKSMMDYMINSGRYELEHFHLTSSTNLKPKMKTKPIHTQKGLCKEHISIKAYIPDYMEITTNGKLLALVDQN